MVACVGHHGLPDPPGWACDVGELPGTVTLSAGRTWLGSGGPAAAEPTWPAPWPQPVAGVPILSSGHLSGAIYLAGHTAPSAEERALLESVALVLALMTERNWARLDLQRSDQQISQILAITADIGRQLDFTMLAQRIVDGLTEVTDFQIATITLRDGETCRRLAASGLAEPRSGLTTRFAQWRELLQPDWRRGTISYLVPPEADAAWSDVPDIAWSDQPDAWTADHALILPLTDASEEFVGFLSVDRPRSGRLPSDRVVEGLELFARQVQVAFVNAHLYTELRQVAERDPLTGLRNRRTFWEELAPLLEEVSYDAPVAMAVLDVDDFKTVNDALGHAVGDTVLRHVADRLVRSCRQTDGVYRIGGEEFVLLLPGTPLDLAAAVVERARSSVRDSRADLPTVTLSAGVAAAPLHADSAEALFAVADAALLLAKRTGKDLTEVARP
jgi:diguanylate cyclase (GGDEF)-like protein